MKVILLVLVCLIANTGFASGGDSQDTSKLKNLTIITVSKSHIRSAIDSTNRVITMLELELNAYVHRRNIELAEQFCKITPSAEITIMLARTDPEIKALREDFVQADKELRGILMKDEEYADLMNKNIKMPSKAQMANHEVINSIHRRLSNDSEEYGYAKERHFNTLLLSNTTALRKYVESMISEGKLIDNKYVINYNSICEEQIPKELLIYIANLRNGVSELETLSLLVK